MTLSATDLRAELVSLTSLRLVLCTSLKEEIGKLTQAAKSSTVTNAIKDLTEAHDSIGTEWWTAYLRSAELFNAGDLANANTAYEAILQLVTAAQITYGTVTKALAADSKSSPKAPVAAPDVPKADVKAPVVKTPPVKPVVTPTPPPAVPVTDEPLNHRLIAILNSYAPEQLLAALQGGLDAGREARVAPKGPNPVTAWVDKMRRKPATKADVPDTTTPTTEGK